MLGERIKALRTEKGIIQQELADALCVAKSTVGMWESNKREPDIDTITKIANYFNCPVAFLLNETIKIGEAYSSDDLPKHCCPICGYEYINLVKVSLIDYVNSTKSSGYALEFHCENEHHFYIVFENHKGNNYMSYTDENFAVIRSVNTSVNGNYVTGANNVQASQIKVGDTSYSDKTAKELVELIQSLPLVKQAEIILMIDKMKHEEK